MNNLIFETHAHYNLESFDDFRKQLMVLMHNNGIKRCVIPAIEYHTNDAMKKLFDDPLYDWVYYVFGAHPKYLWKDAVWEDGRWEAFASLIQDPKCVRIGETGLDYSYREFCEAHQKLQEQFFVRFIELGNAYELPLVLHLRPSKELSESMDTPNVDEDAMRILEEHPIRYGAVCHCFGGDTETMNRYIAHGVSYFGIGGRITYEEPDLIGAVRHMPEESILLETDAPYIKLPGDRGPNTSLSLYRIAEKIAEIRETTMEHIIQVTYENAERLFKKAQERI